MRRLTIEDARKEADKHGGECLDSVYTNTRSKMSWRCEQGHVFSMTMMYMRRGFWCPDCADHWYDLGDAIRIAQGLGGQCLSHSYVRYSSLLKWRCKERHEWEATMRNIMLGHWCGKCARCVKLTIDDCNTLAKQNNGCCLSSEYINNHTNLLWQCSSGHTWKACYKSIYRGTWCPDCAILTSQGKLRNTIERIFPLHTVRSNNRDFDWLKTIGSHKQEIDIWVPEIKLAIEYDGEQHFMPICFGNMTDQDAIDEFKQIKRRDRLKNRRIKAHPEDIAHFIRFSYKEPLTTEYVRNRLIKAGVKIEDQERPIQSVM